MSNYPTGVSRTALGFLALSFSHWLICWPGERRLKTSGARNTENYLKETPSRIRQVYAEWRKDTQREISHDLCEISPDKRLVPI